MDPRNTDTNAMAFMGDAVYEVYIRRMLIRQGVRGAHRLHNKAVHFVNASAQARALRAISDELSEEEAIIVRRARNHRTATKAKHADPVTYKLSTAFEALLGYLYLSERPARAEHFMERAAILLRGGEEKHGKEKDEK